MILLRHINTRWTFIMRTNLSNLWNAVSLLASLYSMNIRKMSVQLIDVRSKLCCVEQYVLDMSIRYNEIVSRNTSTVDMEALFADAAVDFACCCFRLKLKCSTCATMMPSDRNNKIVRTGSCISYSNSSLKVSALTFDCTSKTKFPVSFDI